MCFQKAHSKIVKQFLVAIAKELKVSAACGRISELKVL